MSPFTAIFVPDALADAVSDAAWLAALLDAERALVEAEAEAGIVPAGAATAIAEACRAGLYDAGALAHEGRAAGNPVEPLVRAIRAQVGDEHADFVHRGATSQDMLDSAAMLVAQRTLLLIDVELDGVAAACAHLAEKHRGTVMAARTLLQQAVPTTFGYKAAGWLVGVVEARARLAAVELPAQLGGAAGTLAALGNDGPEVLRLFAARLGLREPVLPWHTRRTPIVDLAGALAGAAAAAAKIGTDVVLLAQTEVGEVAEAEGGASSTMPHKRNPTNAILADACARHARANAGVLLESAVQEHERAVGAWHAEWHALAAALAATGGAAAAIRRSLDGLVVNAERMRANIGDETLSEARRLGARCRCARRLSRCGRRVRRPRARALPRMSGTVVLCGSLGSTSAMWAPQLPALAGRRVVTVEHPGHGDAPVTDVQTVSDLAARVPAEAGDDTFSFVGLSLGGAIGMRLALDAPDRIEKLVLACTAARFGEPDAWHERAETVREQGLEAIADAVLARWFTPGLPAPPGTATCSCPSIPRATRAAARRSPAGTSATSSPGSRRPLS